jgi:hypothetical protein
MSSYERMMSRIETNARELEPYEDILTYDWPNAEEHYEWVATAELTEIIDWCITILADAERIDI